MNEDVRTHQILDSGSMKDKIIVLESLSQSSDQETVNKIISKLDDSEIEVRGEAFSSLFLNKNDISIGYYKENENTDTSDPENILYSFGYIFGSNSGLVFKGIIDYNKSEGITGSVNPVTSITIDGTVLFVYDLNTFSINYEYIQNKHEDLGDSSDKYRIDEQFVNIINLGFITNL